MTQRTDDPAKRSDEDPASDAVAGEATPAALPDGTSEGASQPAGDGEGAPVPPAAPEDEPGRDVASSEPTSAEHAPEPQSPDSVVEEPTAGDPPSEPVPPPRAASLSRWEIPVEGPKGEGVPARSRSGDGGLTAALRVLALVLVAGGALYGGLMAVRPDGETAPVTVRAPRVEDTRSVAAEPGPRPRPLTVEGYAGIRDLDLRGQPFRFVRLVPQSPTDVCQIFAEAGWAADGWGASPIGDLGECLAQRAFGGKRAGEAFAVLRGRDTLLEIRIKLNLYDPARRNEAAGATGDVVAGLFERWRWDGADRLKARIASLTPFEETSFGTRVVLARERGDVERWNLTLRFPSPPKPPEDKPKAPTLADIGAMSENSAPGVPSMRDTP